MKSGGRDGAYDDEDKRERERERERELRGRLRRGFVKAEGTAVPIEDAKKWLAMDIDVSDQDIFLQS